MPTVCSTLVDDRPVSFSGIQAIGYLLIDPETGAGAYKVGTGAIVGILVAFLGLMFPAFGAIAFTIGVILTVWGLA